MHGKRRGLTGASVDDTIGGGDMQFESQSKITGERFQSKPREYDQFQVAGIQIEKLEGDCDGYLMHQQRFAKH